MTDQIIGNSIKGIAESARKNSYRGYDPYDALKSPLFNLPFLRSNGLIRFASQQFLKRFPFNIRPLLGIPRGYNPVTLGLFIQGYAYLSILCREPYGQSIFSLRKDECITRILMLISELNAMKSKGYSGACWGYDFPWEARYVTIPACKPTIVATGIIANALFSAFKMAGIEECAQLVISSSEFVMNDLNKTEIEDELIFSYSPFDNQKVFNASMKGVRLLAQAYHLCGKDILKTEAKKAVHFVVKNQEINGSWRYSLSPAGKWIDNYHSGYILDCLHEYIRLTGDNDKEITDSLYKGYDFYRTSFIEKPGIPRFYSDRTLPVDCTSAAQSILTLTRFGSMEEAQKVALWMISHMQSKSGNFYYRKYLLYINKTSFIRWSDAWMFAALSYHLCKSLVPDLI